jgi:hypothetical protein
MPVHRLPTAEWSDDVPIASTLVRNHRESVIAREQRSTVPKVIGLSKAMGQALPQASVFDFEAEEARKKGE